MLFTSFFTLNCSPAQAVASRYDLPDIHIDRTFPDAPAAADTGDLSVIGLKVAELVHDSLPQALFTRWPRIVAGGVEREQAELAGIPQPHPPSLPALVFILNIEAVTGGADIGAGSTAKAFLLDRLPQRVIK